MGGAGNCRVGLVKSRVQGKHLDYRESGHFWELKIAQNGPNSRVEQRAEMPQRDGPSRTWGRVETLSSSSWLRKDFKWEDIEVNAAFSCH